MRVEFNQWVDLLQLALELGKENGYVIYDENEWNEHDGDYEVAKEVIKSDMFDDTVFLSFKKVIRNKVGLTPDKKEILKELMGSASSKQLDFNAVRDEYKNGELSGLFKNRNNEDNSGLFKDMNNLTT